jgi:hypothetical protein
MMDGVEWWALTVMMRTTMMDWLLVGLNSGW